MKGAPPLLMDLRDRSICLSYAKDVYIARVGAGLADVSEEFYRRVMAPHEDQKMKENGDVYQ